jgi:SAM-dependent methyltransferase
MLVIKHCLSLGVPFNYGPLGHLQATHQLWKTHVKPGDLVVDATCGNGHDSLYLSKLAIQSNKPGKLYCIDVQEEAIASTRRRLLEDPHLAGLVDQHVCFVHGSHESFPASIEQSTVALICYNLGYLPGKKRLLDMSSGVSDALITKPATTISSLRNALPLVKEGGLVSVVAYPGHAGGSEELEAVKEFLATLDDQTWRVYGNFPLNKPKLPVLFNAFKIDKGGSK